MLPLLSVLELGHEGVRYFANSAIKSDVFQLNQRADEDRYIHVIAFLAHQFYQLQDNLLDTLLTVVPSAQNTAQREHKEWTYAQRQSRDQMLGDLVTRLDNDVFSLVRRIQACVTDNCLNNAEKVAGIQTLIDTSLGAGVIEQAEQELSSLKQTLDGHLDEGHYYNALEARSLRLQNRLSAIVKAIDFQSTPSASALTTALEYFKSRDGALSKTAPTEFLTPDERRAIHEDSGEIRVSLYKAFLFVHIADAIKSGNFNLQHSYKYRPLDDYLIDKERWDQEKTALLGHAGLERFTDPDQVLGELQEALHRQYEVTNKSIGEGGNPYMSFAADGAFRVATPKQDDVDAEPLQHFFPDRHYLPLSEILATVEHHSGFLGELQHWQQRYNRSDVPKRMLYAAVMGLGCAIGTRKMVQISSHMNERELDRTVNWYLSLENVRAANDKVVGLMDRMDMPNRYRRSPQALHTASDGQKFEVRTESLNANYSFKYFGKGQGVSAYTFVDERHLLWHSMVFSAAERESAYVIDGLMRNDVVKSDIHSTDTHGYSKVIFAATHLLGFSYAPRIKNLGRQTLYGFKTSRSLSDWQVRPQKNVAVKLIRTHWDDILRFIATIALKEATASDIFRRLNSYSKQHDLYRALKAFGQVVKSLFVLRYIHEPELRQAVEKQLNKVELANRFTRAVAIGNPREFTQSEKEDQEVAEACNRLIKNSIVCWNYLYLSHRLARAEGPEQKEVLLAALHSHSAMSWAHINLLGEYDFSDDKLRDSIGMDPPKLAGLRSRESWEVKNREIRRPPNGLQTIL